MTHCALCLENKDLVKSHIIPNSFFKRIKPKGKATEINVYSAKPRRTVQNSWYENLLCSDCETLLSEWERYSIGVIYTPEVVGVKKEIGSKLGERWFGVDYKKFRLFQLSILFRSAVAKGSAYANVRLSEKELTQLRDSLVKSDPIEPHKYGCIVSVLLNPVDNKKLNKTVGSPSFDIRNGRKQFIFVFGGYIWEYRLPNLTYKDIKKGFFLNKNGFLKCPSISLWDHPIIGSTFGMAFEKEIDRMKRKEKSNNNKT